MYLFILAMFILVNSHVVCLMMGMFVSNGLASANLSTEGYTTLLSEHPSGVYFGWAGLSSRGVYKMVMSIGWNPYFDNKEKTIVILPIVPPLAFPPFFLCFLLSKVVDDAGAMAAS